MLQGLLGNVDEQYRSVSDSILKALKKIRTEKMSAVRKKLALFCGLDFGQLVEQIDAEDFETIQR